METLRIAATALNTHKLRSFLTLLGVIIGVMTVVSVVSIIAGLNNFVSEKLFQLNPDVYVVTQFGIITSREQFLEAVKRKPIEWGDFEAVRQRCQTCAAIGAHLQTRGGTKRESHRLAGVQIHGGTANTAEINNLDLEAGRFYTGTEEEHSAFVAVIGSDVRDELFGKLDPIGRMMLVANQPMRVIGLLRKQGSLLGQSQDNVLYIPLSTFRKRFGTRRSIDLFIRSVNGIPGMQKSMDEVRVILRARRRTAFRAVDPFSMVTAEALQTVWKGITAGAFALMILISGISLVVGGIVIMNIMLVSVIERTREIGIRRALGATRRKIQLQFLTESVLLALGGGLVGVILGVIVSRVIAAFFLPTLVRPSLVITGLLVAVLTGMAAGYFPARRAANLAPVEALRYE
ncbi:MAG TPA: ABC transporter permease [Thermoanaerobaculia bacterium]|jgi:putative ABC transport system permease protein|nr:ABC transporter permease [Thermoanaerobaculia bacterium]